MHPAAAQVPFSGTRYPHVLLLKCVSTAGGGGELVPDGSCVAESPDPPPPPSQDTGLHCSCVYTPPTQTGWDAGIVSPETKKNS